MGFFTKDVIPAPGGIVPLSKERIKAALEAQGWSYSVDADGDICGGWDYATFYFFVFGGFAGSLLDCNNHNNGVVVAMSDRFDALRQGHLRDVNRLSGLEVFQIDFDEGRQILR